MSTRTPEWFVQKAVYAALTGDTDLMAVITGVYDHVPAETTVPYIVIGDDTSIEFDTKTNVGEEVTLTIHIWSEHEGRKELKEIQGHLARILHDQLLTVEDHNTVLVRREYAETLRDPDGATWHGVVRFRIIVTAV